MKEEEKKKHIKRKKIQNKKNFLLTVWIFVFLFIPFIFFFVRGGLFFRSSVDHFKKKTKQKTK